MKYPYVIPGPWRGRLAIVARPRGGDWLNDDVQQWKASGVDIVVSALTASEETHFDLPDEAAVSRRHDIEFISIPIEDREVPPPSASIIALLEHIENALVDGKSVAIHCRQGLGRAPLLAASVLVLTGIDATEAFHRISESRGASVPETAAQEEWVRTLAREIAPVRR